MKEAREQLAATAAILKVIASSPNDVQLVFDAIAASANRLIGGHSTAVHRIIDDTVHLMAFTSTSPEGDEAIRAEYPRPRSEVPAVAMVQTGETAQFPDSETADEHYRYLARARGWRSTTITPLMSQGAFIGYIACTRRERGMLVDHHVQLLRTFADQAVIAIQNARLFSEVEQRTRDLQESLKQQTATADVLKVISRSAFDLQPVFDTIVQTASQLCDSEYATIYELRDDDKYHMVANNGADPIFVKYAIDHPLAPERGYLVGRTALERKTIHMPDCLADPEYVGLEYQSVGHYRSMLGVPLLREGAPVGVIALMRRAVLPFTEKQIELVTTFADQAVIAIANVRLFDEVQAKTHDLSESLQQQTATADVLKVINRSAFDLDSVLSTLVESAAKLCAAEKGVVYLRDGASFRIAYNYGFSAEFEAFARANPLRVDGRSTTAHAAASGKPAQTVDIGIDDERLDHIALGYRQLGGYRTNLGVPLRRESEIIGVFTLSRDVPEAFTDRQIELVGTFADQAVIAIENTRLINETREALERQTATADILKVIASSPSDVQPVFEAIADRSNRLMEGLATAVYSIVDDTMHLMAFTRISPEADAALQANFPRPLSKVPWTIPSNGGIVEVPDAQAEWADQPDILKVVQMRGFRSVLLVPLTRDGATVGVISVTRKEFGRFEPHHIQLLQTFADQAVIAIGNVQLFEQVQARTRDLTESLEQQTATSEVLRVISSSAGDLAPVFDAMLSKAMQLCDANFGVLNTYDGSRFHTAATYGLPPAYDEFRRRQPVEYGPGTAPARLLQGEPHVEIQHLIESEAYVRGDPNRRALVDTGGARSLLAVPLLKDEQVVGNVLIFRQEDSAFSEKQITLLKQFAAQAVIAIENTRLLNELRQRTSDLSESLQQQTATSEVLQVISSSPGDLDPVFQKMLENACLVCGANFGTMNLWDGEEFSYVARHNIPSAFAAYRQQTPIRPHPDSPLGKVVRTRQFVHEHDLRANPAFLAGVPNVVAIVEIAGARTVLVVPMLKEDEMIGTITIYRKEVRPFTDKQIAVVENFTKQAVIAIENTRLLRELRERTDDLQESLQQQTATADVLQVISASPGDLAPVFEKMLENATRVCGAEFGTMNLVEDNNSMRQVASYNVPAAFAEVRIDRVFRPPPQGAMATAIRTKQVVQLPDMRTSPHYLARVPSTVELVELGGARTVVLVPMVRENEVIGVMTIYRQEVRSFSDKQIELMSNFAKQAVIAIENARLLKELRQRTDDLSKSLNDLRTAQDRLIQTEKLASLGQLTAGIAHEIKNPLNFVNNFSALSAELTDELNDALKPLAMDSKVRGEVDELTGLLRDNLEKVVQHGKRADSIVKNMLLHSREGSGERRASDVNSLVDESLNLAYHGARAENSGFNITLERDFDTDAGVAEVFPQEITRALLNLISNGFYAATRRKAGIAEAGFEPTLRVSTKDIGDAVEIRIRDNGTGIPLGVKEKMFNPFFTTKPAGEGTGLGLSMTHDIIVKQHGGQIDVLTEPGQFAEFIISLPRSVQKQ